MASGEKTVAEAKARQRARLGTESEEKAIRQLNAIRLKEFLTADNLHWSDVKDDVLHVCDLMADITQLQSYRAITLGMNIPHAYMNDAILAKQVGRVFIRVYQINDDDDDGD